MSAPPIVDLFKNLQTATTPTYTCFDNEKEKLKEVSEAITLSHRSGLNEVTVRIGCELDYVCDALATAGFKVAINAQPLRITIYWGRALKQLANQ